MKWKDREISKLILKKSNSYLKISIILFLLTLMMPVFFGIYMINEKTEQENNYTYNDNVHMIRLDGRLDNKTYSTLTNQEGIRLEQILNQKGYQDCYTITPLFKIIGATDSEKGNAIEIFGISKNAAQWIVNSELKDDTMYMKSCKPGKININIPIIEMKDEGVEVNESVDLKLNLEDGVKEDSPLSLYVHEFSDLSQAYVTEETCLELLKQMYKLDDSISSLYANEIENILVVEEIYVYVKDVYKIDEIAKLLKDNGYCTTYTFEAFDSLSTSLLKANFILSCLMGLVLLISAVNLIFSFWSYLKVQQKDMGILMSYGYSKKRLYSIYRRNINRIFFRVGAVAMILSTILWLVFNHSWSFKSLIIILFIILAIILTVSRAVLLGPLRSYINKDRLNLIKQSKEFE